MEYAKFLQETAKEMARELQTSRSGEMKQTAEDLDEFLNKVFSQFFFLDSKA
jgi:LETM1 and EF-hand domain-containing protein 1